MGRLCRIASFPATERWRAACDLLRSCVDHPWDGFARAFRAAVAAVARGRVHEAHARLPRYWLCPVLNKLLLDLQDLRRDRDGDFGGQLAAGTGHTNGTDQPVDRG